MRAAAAVASLLVVLVTAGGAWYAVRGAGDANAAAPVVACGSWSNAERRVAIASYSARGVSCKRALRIVLAARARLAGDRRIARVQGFTCRVRRGEAEAWWVCRRGGSVVRAHSVVF